MSRTQQEIWDIRRWTMAQKIDYVLVYEHPDFNRSANEEAKARLENLRRRFMVAMKKDSLDVEEERVGKYMFVKVSATQERLYQEAEQMRVELPLYGLILKNPEIKCSMIEKRMKRILSARGSNVQVTAPFQKKCLDLFLTGHPNGGPVFWSALRSFLVYNILSQLDIARKGEEDGAPKRQGIAYLMMVGAFSEGFVVHDPSTLEPVSMKAAKRGMLSSATATSPESASVPSPDVRRQLQRLWGNSICRRQPIHMIRDYFGEKIAFYFAWVSTFISSLWIPAFLGLVVFVFGVVKRLTESDQTQTGVLRYIDIIKNSSDNALTPCFATIICLWGTILMEIWKRRQISLAHQWHVEDFDTVEPDRPQFHGTHTRVDPLTGETKRYYPFISRLLKYFSSASALLFMVMLVFISVMSVILYRVFMTVTWCDKKGDGMCNLLHGTVIATLLNTVSIMILGRVYDHIAVKLTDWENHRTTSEYTDALIIKLYAFQFANTYTSLFYTAFFRRDFGGVGIFGLGKAYTDNCGDKENSNCMSMLSFQLLVLMILKPFPKFLRDVIIPLMKRCLRRIRVNEIDDVHTDGGISKQHYLLREKFKQSAEDFRLGEFTEKMIQYGYLMMFAASFPLAPLLALIFNVFDLRIDARRLLWWTKRPTPFRDNDIGIWFQIINFINVSAVISNAFLIAFNSEVGRDQPLEIKFAIIIGFEHFVFLMKFALSLVIPDTPTWVKNSQRKERFLISYLMSQWATSRASASTAPAAEESDQECKEPVQHSQSFDHCEVREREEAPQTRWSYG